MDPLFAPGTKAEFDAKLKAMSESDTLPDVGYFRPESIHEYGSNGFFLDLTPFVAKDNLKKDYLAQTWITQNGKIIGAYTAAEAQVMYYNKKLLQDAGVPLPPTDYTKAWTWDQAVAYWTKLTIDKAGKHPGEAWKLQKWMMTPDKTLNLYAGGLWMPTKASWYTNKDDLAKWLNNPAHPEGFKAAVLDSMAVARAEPIGIKNYDQLWAEYINPELDKVWAGKATAETALKTAADKIRKSGLLQGTW